VERWRERDRQKILHGFEWGPSTYRSPKALSETMRLFLP